MVDDPRRSDLLDGYTQGDALWVFGYGSLMWSPGFPVSERVSALLRGWHRRFCVVSHVYRGTPEKPGLVLGLDRGGACRGLAMRVEPAHARKALDYLWDREMITRVYRPMWRVIETEHGKLRAATFVADREHEHYVPERDPAWAARTIADAIGRNGSNRDYLKATLAELDQLGIHDRHLRAVLAALPPLAANQTPL
jgi:glutathione-specific gamma-glutamylcyclotransferase